MDYETAKKLSQSRELPSREMVARDVLTAPEILYFLAEDEDERVRFLVAGNQSTPHQADLLLADDRNIDVRVALAGKIGQLLPQLNLSERSKLSDAMLSILRKLAEDQAMRVRAILSDALQALPNAPRDVINRLARDVELRVAEPVLRYSPVLTDEDLLDIISSNPIMGALPAIAKRQGLSPTLSEDIAGRDDVEAITALLGNASAQIREATLDKLLERAPAQPTWHEPLVKRPQLPVSALKRLAQFVSRQLLDVLRTHPSVDENAAVEIAEIVRTRIAEQPDGDVSQMGEEEETPQERAARLYKSGELDEPVIAGALEAGERSFVLAALAIRAGTQSDMVAKIFSAHSAKGVTAITWKAGLSMRLALQLQTRMAGISPQAALYPKDGADFPLSEDDLRWQLEFFGIV
jgi:uncharacterized protein (DUF2336 family)